jgi:hypothetical protein
MISFPRYLPIFIKTWGMLILLLGGVAATTSAARAAVANNWFLGFSFLAMTAIALFAFRARQIKISKTCSSVVFLLTCASVALWGMTYNSGQVSDFGVYYRCGVATNHNMDEWLTKCQSAYLSENSTYWLRSYFYSSAIGRLFGDSYLTFKLSNITLHCATLITWYFGIKKYYGHGAAAVATLLLSIFPEYWFSTTLVTTDNAAVLAAVLFLLLLPKLQGHTIISVLAAIAVGLVAFFGNQLRSIGAIFVLALFFWAICAGIERRQWSIILLSAVSVVSYCIFTYGFNLANPVTLPDLFSPIKMLSAIDFHTSQDFSVNYYWAEHFWLATPEANRLPIALYKLATEFSAGFSEWPLYLYRKAEVIFSGTGYYGLSSFPYPSGNPNSLVTDVVSDIPFSIELFPWLGLCVLVTLALAVVGVLRAKLSGPALCSILFVGAFGLVVIGAGEAQARYSVLLAPALSLLAALSFFPHQDANNKKMHAAEYAYGTIGLTVIYLVAVGLSAFLPTSEKITEGAKLASISSGGINACDNSGISIIADYKKIRVNFSNDSSCASISLPVGTDSTSIGFYLSGSKLPFKFEEHPGLSATYKVFAGDSEVAGGQLARKTVEWVEATVSPGPNEAIVLLLNRSAGKPSDYFDVSLIRESKN